LGLAARAYGAFQYYRPDSLTKHDGLSAVEEHTMTDSPSDGSGPTVAEIGRDQNDEYDRDADLARVAREAAAGLTTDLTVDHQELEPPPPPQPNAT
jgi:hypothetical protein